MWIVAANKCRIQIQILNLKFEADKQNCQDKLWMLAWQSLEKVLKKYDLTQFNFLSVVANSIHFLT